MLGIPEAYLGHAAGLTTSVLWTGTSLLFTAAARRLGPTVVNSVRILMAVVLLGVTHRVLMGVWIPVANAQQVMYLALSGIVGLAIGDQALFTAYVDIGPRLAMLIMTTAPLVAGLFGFVVLGERLTSVAWLGIALTVSGVGWVVLERPQTPVAVAGSRRTRGMLLAFVAAGCQAGGLLLSKQGIGHGWLAASEHLKPQTATLLRMFFAGLAMVPILAVYGLRERRQEAAGIRARQAGAVRMGLLMAFGGAMVGPFLGVWMSLEAANRAPLGVAQTLCSLPPILILPLAGLVFRERISLRAVLGAFVAVGGVALLFWPHAS